jgi:glycosyltransferase involved in cell wall biosynthesis
MVILEAIAVKTCVIATRVGGIPECIGEDEGWLVHPNSTQALAEAVLAAMKSGPTRFERAEKALESAERKFAVETILSKWDEEFSLKSSHRG